MRRRKKLIVATVGGLICCAGIVVCAQPPGGPRGFGFPGFGGPPDLTSNEAKELKLYPATEEPPAKGEVTITVEGDKRIIRSNVLPKHKIGEFPNQGNPNVPSAQRFSIELPLKPKANDRPTEARMAVGVFLNGVFLEAGTGEFFSGGGRGWNYEALGGAIDLGLDANHAHVQPTGKYHYHGKPTGLLKELGVTEEKHSPIVGWAFDGFPIYAMYGYENGKDADSKIIENTSSYRLKKGERPAPPNGPGGKYDGAFTADYEYVEGLGTLDECNGRFTVTPDFPDGTYAYFLTNEWPVIFRNFRGTSAMRGPGGPGRGPGRGGFFPGFGPRGGPGGPGGRPGPPGGRGPGRPGGPPESAH